MGVTGLWQVVQPCARPTNLATLNRQRMAVDASIWIYQFLKAMRDKEGNAMLNGHIVGFFRRICRLLFYGVKPVFVFDGGAPILKRTTIQARRKRREGRRDDAAKTAGKLLAVQMQRLADQEDERRKQLYCDAQSHRHTGHNEQGGAMAGSTSTGMVSARRNKGAGSDREEEPIPNERALVYVDEIGMSQRERAQSRRFQKQDAYHLPELPGGIDSMSRPEDPRIMSAEELEEYAQQFNSGEDVNLYDFSKIDFNGDFFKSLPPADRYNILNAARLRSRLRMGISRDQLDRMFPDRMAFSKFQVDRVKERNRLTQRLMYEVGMSGTDLTLGVTGRIAGEKDREYILVKNEGVEGGWALGVVSKNKDLGESHRPIDVDEIDVQFQKSKEEEEDSDEEEDFEDVPIEGVNRLPKPRVGRSAADYMHEQAQVMGASIHQLYGIVNEDDDSLFVSDTPHATNNLLDSRSHNGDPHFLDEDEDVSLAIAMSIERQYDIDKGGPGPEKNKAPAWIQKATDEPRSFTSSGTGPGLTVARVVNNRARAAVPAPSSHPAADKSRDDSSDSEVDFGKALVVAARKKKLNPTTAVVSPMNRAGTPAGPLPFDSIDWRKSVFTLANEQIVTRADNTANSSAEKAAEGQKKKEPKVDQDSDQTAGGFCKPSDQPEGGSRVEYSAPSSHPSGPVANTNVPRQLPPWLTDSSDITEGLKVSRATEVRQVAENEAYLAGQAVLNRQKRENGTIRVESSSEESEVEVIKTHLVRPKRLLPEPSKIDQLCRDVEPFPAQVELPNALYEKPSAAENDLIVFDENSISEQLRESSLAQAEGDDDEGEEFEDVEIPAPAGSTALAQEEALGLHKTVLSEVQPALARQINDEDEDIFAGIKPPVDAAVQDVYSDPEDDELMAQMVEEAEAHAQFTSSLNHIPSQFPTTQEYLSREIASLQVQKQKEQRDSDEVTQVMITEVQSLLRLFGIPYITAPMEAEAQCAELVRLGLVDGIVTDDSDTFLFGGTRVYKNMFSSNSKYVECYLAADMEQELSLGRKELIALAQLLGSDYVEGLPGIGPVTAVELLAEFPGQDGLEKFRDWWVEIQARGRLSESDSKSKFRKKLRKAQGKKLFLPPGFPSLTVEEAYMQPQVDSSTEDFVWGVPDLDGLRRFLMGTVGWGPEKTDEVLVPVVKDMNRRAVEGTQSNITRFFTIASELERQAGAQMEGGEITDQGAGGEVFAPRRRLAKSKRMADAVGKLRAGRVGNVVVADEPNSSASTKSKTGRKRKVNTTRSSMTSRYSDGEDGDEEYQDGEQGGEVDGVGVEALFTKESGRKGKKRTKAV